ncbi:hypothetical protein B0T25DRAFT_543070 [Lasiosphaeria hispida]|uniref:ABM domain-containing protein n=1 Tax=Lasiosphaeria hispida TaxID=260671 RepID=A0AAJ0MDX0_9PEZI|nr:hypothetical protein B0T25DRAFT_543070 [Lasiosphaeria hispida]
MRFYNSSLFVPFALWIHHASAAGRPVFFFTLFPTSTTELRDQLISRMDNISHWSCTNEVGVTKYALVVPRGGGDNLTAYSIEQYDDDATFNKHLAADVVSGTLFNWSRNTPNLWAKDPVVQNFTVLDGQNFVKPEFAKAADPYIVIEALTYAQGGVHHVLEHWEEEVAASQKESGTLLFGLYTDPVDESKLWTLAAYESAEYLTNIHAKSPTASDLEKHTKGMRTSLKTTLLQKRGGFLYKGSPSCA